MNKTSPNDNIFFQVFNEIGIIQQLGSSAFEKVLPEGLKISQFSVLNHFIRLGDGSTPLQLAKAFQVTKGAMTNTLNRLLDRQLIFIEPDPSDGRSKRVFITEKGREVRDECIHRLIPFFLQLREEFSETEFKAALPFLQQLRKFLDESRN